MSLGRKRLSWTLQKASEESQTQETGLRTPLKWDAGLFRLLGAPATSWEQGTHSQMKPACRPPTCKSENGLCGDPSWWSSDLPQIQPANSKPCLLLAPAPRAHPTKAPGHPWNREVAWRTAWGAASLFQGRRMLQPADPQGQRAHTLQSSPLPAGCTQQICFPGPPTSLQLNLR